jgi:hypothetical protein
MNEALIFRYHQDAIHGTLAEIREEYVVVLSSEHEVQVPFREISRILLTFEHGLGRGPITGALLAGYASACILATSHGHGGYVESPDLPWYPLVVVPSIALGAGIGFLVDPGSGQKEEVFDFTGTDADRAREKSRLERDVTQGWRASQVHISFQGSRVNPNIPKLVLPGSTIYYDNSTTTTFNVLRKAQVTYSVVPEVEVGVALVWFSEPPELSSGYETASNRDTKIINGFQWFEATGKYIVAFYNPLYHRIDPRLDINVGGGLGTASIDYRRTITVWTNTPSGTSLQQDFSFNVPENSAVGYLACQLQFKLFEGFSVGLVADKVFGPSRDAPAVPEAGVPAQIVHFDNASVGFTIGLDF